MTGDPFDLTGQVAVITGGGSGIGYGFADGLARAGASVAILGRDVGRLDAAAERLRAHGNPVLTLGCDVAEESAVVAAIDAVADEFGRLDSCFANAGVNGPYQGLLDTSLDSFRAVNAVNLDGAFVTLREAARHMVAFGNGGSLVATSSVGARNGMPKQLAYAASKGALISLIMGIAVDLARYGIRANSVLPGFVDTGLTHDLVRLPQMVQRVLPRVPARRWGIGADYGALAVYLASPASAYHTGDTLVVDGGYGIF